MAKLCPERKLEAAQDLFDTDPDNGLIELEKLVKQYPSDIDVRFSYGRALVETDQPELALEHLEFVNDRKKTSSTLTLLTANYAMLGMEAHAQNTARKAIERGATGINPELLNLKIDKPENVKEKDFLEFERARYKISSHQLNPALANLKRFCEQYKTFLPAWNTFSTGLYSAGDFPAARAAALHVHGLDPQNAAGIKNLIWVELVTRGPQAIQSLRQDVLAAATPHPGAMVVKTQALVLLEEWNAVLEACEAFDNLPDDENRRVNPDFVDLMLEYRSEALLRLGRELPEEVRAPFQAFEQQLTIGFKPTMDLDELLPTAFEERWTQPWKRAHVAQEHDLRLIPGWLSLIPSQLGFSPISSVLNIADVLLEMTDPPEPVGAWTEVFSKIALEGPGNLDARVALLEFLTDREILSAQSVISIPGWPVQEQAISLTCDKSDRPFLEGEDAQTLSKSVQAFKDGRYEQSRRMLMAVLERHPLNFLVEFNLASCEVNLDGWRKTGLERLQKITLEHPDYLPVRINLASLALQTSDLETAHKHLTWTGKDLVHVQDYSQFLAVLGMVWISEDKSVDNITQLDVLLQQLGPERQSVLAFRQRLMPYMMELLEEIRESEDDDEVFENHRFNTLPPNLTFRPKS